jgi:hypothetical protein
LKRYCMLTYADVYGTVCWRMLTYVGGHRGE